ncbi:hypothetical protein PHSY_003220 [Pseudozyma hubeiensis SY62]|uniref:Uncharacterized protein n=1 Tax=Pseudozyma hubeiensis (strain SY62) TaxID=1305764 RepID=R9P2W6_PSEHS|nr:hypothetical protein PHSY_003220 [Pseudozyma hubeiensis SY62]GAC95644.1 hypothetical protein PHSY_003220 [Pseudozyma hubeiensis SY62]
MSKRSRSDSASSSSSSSSSSSGGSSVEAQTASVSTAKLPASRNLSNIGYRPPRGFEPVSFSSSSSLLHAKLSASKQQQLWAVRIPAGLTPSQLDGVVIDLPRDTTDLSIASKPLGTISSAQNAAEYNFYASLPSSLKGKSRKTPSGASYSQLIAMASETASAQKVDASVVSGQGAASELESLQLLVPAGAGEEAGRMVMAPVKIERCIHLSIASPAETGRAERMKETSNRFEEKKLPQQPWHLLKGNFKPAGSRGGDDGETHEAAEEDKRKVKVEDGKKSKKSRKD